LPRRDRKTRWGVVSLYVSSAIQSKTIGLELVEPPKNNMDTEHLWCEVQFKGLKGLIGVVYRPPAVSYKSLEQVEDLLFHLGLLYDFTLVMGDLNIDLLTQANYFNSLLNSFNLEQVIKEPTRLLLLFVVLVLRGAI